MGVGEERVILEGELDRNSGVVEAVVAETHESRGRARPDASEEVAQENAFPTIVEAAEPHDTMEVVRAHDAGKGLEVLPREAHWALDESPTRRSQVLGSKTGISSTWITGKERVAREPGGTRS